ncbi:WAPA-like protein, partial [Mya arenaria]
GTTIGGTGDIECNDNCAGSIGKLFYSCTDYSISEDWSSGRVGDIDGDIVRCRWADTSEECGEVCHGLPNAELDNVTCSITYSAIYATGWYAVAIQVEDFVTFSSVNALSSIPVQFLIFVYTANENETCGQSMVFINPTPPDDAISEIKTTSPLGMTKSSLYQISPTEWAVNITYSPPNDSDVSNVFCFNAKESSGLEGDKRCITLLTGVAPPAIVEGSQSPTNVVYPGQRTWSLALNNSKFTRATRQSFINLYSDNNILMENIPASNRERVTLNQNNRTLTFYTTTILTEKQTYYFTFDFGIVKGVTLCGAESPAIDDHSFWRIKIHTTPPVLIMQRTPPTISNSTRESFQWTCTYPCNVACNVRTNDQTFQVNCNRKGVVWTLPSTDSNVTYTLDISATDTVGNEIRVKYNWTTDFGKPTITICDKGQSFTMECNSDTKPETICNATASDNMDPLPQLSYTDTSTGSCERSSKRLADVLHNGGIDKQHNYTVSRAVNIPEFITGDYFILVETDVYDNVYEFLGEDNNVSPMQNSLYVALTPPPDLKITSILTPPLWTTGDTVNISWTVQNIGSETPHSQRYWTDLLVLTSGSNTIIASLLRSHYGSLSVDETYTSTVTFYVVPALPTDKYTLHVTADNRNYLFEYLNEANNEIIQQVTVQQALPDLSVEYFNVTIRYETNRTLINADWSVHNVGIGKTVRSQWFDTISVKTQNQNYFTELQTFQNKHGLLPNESYDSNATIDLPFNVYGDVVFKLTTDLDPSSSGDGYLLNNVKTHSTINIQLRAADLTITAVMLSKYVQAGKGVSITYTVQNVGSLDINSTKWTDRIYISDTIGNLQAILNLNTSLALQADLNKNKTYSKTIGFSLPNEMSGQYYLTVIVNDNAMIFEGPNTENNIVKRELNVEAALSADLYVKKIKANAISFATEEYIVSVEWEVQNIGNSMDTRHEWQDAVFYKHIDSDFNVLNTFKIKHALESQDFYQKKETVVLPSKFSGNIFICVQTVFSGELYEANSTANNVLCSISPITIQMASPPTLSANIGEITSLSDNGTFETGSFVKITYSVENTGESRTSMSSWIDSVYISNVNVESVSDLKRIGWHVKDIVHIGALGTGQKYTATSTFQLPMTFSGRPRIYIVSNNTANDGTGENNTDETTGLAKSPILELSYVLPNLQIVSNIKLPSLHGGQPVIVEYQIVNTGNTSVLGNWFDSVYLSEDIILDAFDYKLKSELRLTTLRPNDSVNVNISFILPVDLQTKTYMLAIVCDSRDEIFEVNENDNEFRIDFRLEARLSTDIAVISVNAPAFSSFGSDMNVKWEIVNNGSKSAQGYKCDSVYLSDNEVWDITDMQIGKPKCSFFTLEANSSSQLSESVSASTPQVAANEYNTLVKSRSNVIDINQENNVAITLQKTRIIYDTINVGETVNRNLVGSLVLRVVNVTDDETLMITVSSNSSINVYLKGGSPATFYDFDISSDDPTSSSQVITFPNTENGDYYLLIESSNIKTGGKQSLAISVKYAVFEIIDIYPRMLIPNAQTTLKIKGAMFSSDMHASIYYNNTSDNNFIAKQTLVFTSGLAYSTFHIPEAASTGPITFQLSSLSLNKTIYYENLLIQNGVKGYISAYKESPGRLRVGETGTFLIRIQNLGDSDVNVPILNVEALGDGSFQLQDDTREEFFRKQYLLFCISDDGPSGILLAKDYCQLDLNVRQDDTQVNFASLSMQVWEITQNERSVNPFMQSKNNLRPSHYDENAWDRVWNNFLTLTGNTSLSMGKKMSSVLNEMSVAGRRVRPTLDNAEVVLTLHKEDFLFLKGDEHVYLHQTLGTLTRTDSGFTLRRQDDGNEYVFDRETLKLKHVASLTDGSWLNLEYDQSLLTTIRHSEGSYVVVRYNVRNRIQSMELLNGTANEKVVYEYDFKGELLTSVRTNSDSTTYTYNPDNSLNTISFDDGTRFEFDYNDLGHVKSRRYFISDKEVDRQEYLYTNGGMLSVHSWPAATGYNLTYSESGEIIATHRLGFLPDTVVTTKSTQINYEGDHIVTKRTFGVNSILIEDGNRDSIKAEFNNLGQLIQFKDGRENVYEISVNSNGSIDTVTFPDGTNKTYTYFQNGHQTMTQTGAVNVYEFDENNRLVLKNIGDNMIASYEYDNNGNLERARNSLGEVVISYSDTNVASVAYPDKTINYRYNARNQIREISTNDGYLVKYDFNDLGQMTRVLRENDVVLVTAEYNENGKLKKKTLGNNAYTVYDYDPSSTLLTSLKNFFPNGSLASHFTYTYSIRNRRIAVTSQDGTWKFQYDKAGQVTSMIDPHGNVTRYNYDASKNRQSVSTNNFEVQNTINEMNQYVKYGSTSYDHDKNGNLIQKNGSSGNEVFKYDEENRLVAFHSNGTTCSFKYDAFGHLHSKQCNGRATRYVANIQGLYGADIIEQIESINGVGSTVRFYHGDEKLGLIASTYDNGNVNYFMSVVNVLSENGALVNSYQRDPFGNAIASLENVPSIFTFVGQWGVVDIKEIPDVFYMRTRFYDSDTGRFMSPDTFGLGAHSKNFYAYCANNPVSYKDPKGTCPWCLLMLRTAAKGAVTSVVKYGLTTPRNEWTWGGAAGAAVEGAINGAVKPFKKILPGWAKDVISDVANVAGTATQKLIDDEPYSLRDAAEDFGNKQLDRAQDKLEEKFPLFKKFNKICGAVEKYSGYSGAPCDWKDRIKDFFDKLLDDIINWIQSRDPNDMLGPDGYGPARFISKDLTLKYTIRFENDANATAPAQRVYVEHKYSEHLDARHFVLGKFGFGNLTKEMPIRSKIYQIDDRYPIINGSIVPGTESRDSVTLALRALDSGSGVQRIDLFKREGESITLYKSNITEAIFVLPLETNLPQTILPVAVDFVGNRIDLQDIDQESAITVNVTIETTTPPVEPPVLEVRSTPGYAREPIELQISARNISGVFEDLSIIISDIPPNTLFSKGVLKGDGNLYIDASKFGYINMTTDQYGEIDLKITVMQTIIDQNLSRSTVLRLLIHPYFETVSVQFTACLAEDKNNSVMFSSSVSFVGISNTEITQNISFTLPHVVSLMLPTWVHPLERYNKDSVYQIDTKVALGHLQITRPYKPFNTSVIVRVQPDGVPLKEFVFEFQVGSECSEGSCDCVENHTLECSPIFKQCNCNQAWQGDRCETDVNECTQPTICLSMPNSSCRNREWGYDCLCVEGYDLQNDTCIGNGKGNITTTTSPQTTEPPVSGSLIVQHDVLVKDEEQALQELSLAIVELLTFTDSNSSGIMLDGEQIAVENVRLGSSNDYKVIIIALGVTCACVGLVIVVVVAVRKSRQSAKDVNLNSGIYEADNNGRENVPAFHNPAYGED